jgi:mannose-6-phosphate isomerase
VTTFYPLVFHPVFKERVWGGRTLETLYGKPLPPAVPIGESWEIADRPGDESVIANGAFAGRSLHSLMEQYGADILGTATPSAGDRFPLLCKILDARERLSLQVHPPAGDRALGDPKTEMWFIAQAAPGAELYVGLKRGVTRAAFEDRLREGNVADCFHRMAVRSGDAMFLPSGRVHAIGAGLVIFEIQQNSDTTFRVFDWNRLGLDGRPRELHVRQSLESIDFSDVEPSLAGGEESRSGGFSTRRLVTHDLFEAELVTATVEGVLELQPPRLRVLAVVEGAAAVTGGGILVQLNAGEFCVLPAAVTDASLAARPGAKLLLVRPGELNPSLKRR